MTIVEEVVKKLEMLPPAEQHRVLGFVEGLSAAHQPSVKPPRLMLAYAGSMEPAYAEQYLAIIEEGCEQVDLDEW
jgi:hypothetical protein